MLFVSFASAQPGVRLSDDEVKKVIEDASKTSDKFRDAFKKVSSITTRTGAQVDVKQYMEDYKDTFKRFEEAFDSKHTPSSDLMNLLRMTNEIDALMTRNPDAAGAGSEWQAHKVNMDRLAGAFGTTLGESAPAPRRMSDDQLKGVMEQLQQGSKTLGKAVKDGMKKDATIDKNTRESTEQSLKMLEKNAETLKNLYNDHKPLSSEMQAFLKQMDVIKSFLGEHQLGAAVQSEWDRLDGKARQMTDEYGLTNE